MCERANQLQFLRFISFLLIFLWHSEGYRINYMPPGGNGALCAVSFFFILSGFVTAYSSYNKKTKLTLKNVFHELWKKLKKFYPLYLIIIIISVLYSAIPLNIASHRFDLLLINGKQLLKNLLLIQSWFPQGYFNYVGSAWFLSTIMFLYLFNIPFRTILNKIKESKHKWLLYFIMFIITISGSIIYSYFIQSLKTEFWGYVFPPARLGEYLAGMVLGYMVIQVKKDFLDKKMISSKSFTVVFTILELIILILWFKNIYTIHSAWTFRIVAWIPLNIIMILIFGIGKGLLSKIFQNRYLKQLGDISFECFLIHQIVLHIYYEMSGVRSISTLGNVFSMLYCLILTVAFAYFIHKYTSRKKL